MRPGWVDYYINKNDWQCEAYRKIKNRLLLVRDNPFVRFGSSSQHHLAIVYGKAQTGKTSLILSMIGIREDCFDMVYDTLRADIPKGNSSTSTVMIYSRSTNDKYGCSESKFSGSEGAIKYYDSDGMKKRLQKIRKSVEENSYGADRVLHIYIPSSYFETFDNNISILDMPGVGSRNTMELEHVTALMNRYIAIASVCIVVWPPDQINSLRTDPILKSENWSYMDHKYILVLTHAFSNQSCREKWNIEHGGKQYYQFILDWYKDKVSRELGVDNKTEVYPIEVGESYVKLCKNVYEKERSAIAAARSKILNDIRSAIVKRKGDQLSASVRDLKMKVEALGKKRKDELEKRKAELSAKREQTQLLIKDHEKQIEREKSKESSAKRKNDRLADLKKELMSLSVCATKSCNDFLATVDQDKDKYITRKWLGRIFYRCKEEANSGAEKQKYGVIYELLGTIIENRCNELKNQLKALESRYESIFDFPNIDRLVSSITSELLLFQSYYKKKLNSVGKRNCVYQDDIGFFCMELDEKFVELFETERKGLIKNVDEIIYNSEMKLKAHNLDIDDRKWAIGELKQKEVKYMKQIEDIEKEQISCDSSISKDQETLNVYMDFVKEAFLEKKCKIIKDINSARSPKDKMMNVLLLGIIEEDYRKMCEVEML